ncbi:carbamoyltransferase HypF, partial [Candidatus Sumerlaeota bacterium]|nr:carbamoyltransferase HypF [Candidatus Sumerlaeota bacterium]
CGDILAVKGVSGFHLMADARSETAVRRLREIKRREAKPFALMYPNLARLECDVVLNDAERAALLSPEAPIVLVERRAEADLAESIAPHNPLIGAMIAYSPLHHLLLDELGGPIIATSANFGEEPIIILNAEAERVFGDLVDGILMHDRDILRRADDSIIRIIDDTPCPIRIGRGMSPVCIEIPGNRNPGGEGTILALGGHEKSSIALAKDGAIYLSRHLGDLDTPASREAYREAVSDFLALYDCRPDLIVCDLHPDYFSTRVGIELAREFGCELLRVQHHAAHLYSLILELENSSQANLSFFGVRELAPAFVPAGCRQTMGFNLARASLRLESGGKPPHSKEAPAHIRPMDESGEGNLAGICWDGTGLGTDGDIWGAEWLLFDTDSASGFRRAASLLPIPLPGGETCVREPWRIALALAHESGVSPEAAVLSPDQSGFLPERAMRIQVEKLIAGRRNSVPASSMGRLFDGVASLLGLRHRAQFSAQPAMELEFLAMGLEAHRLYEIPILRGEAAHFGVRELAPAFDMAACRRDSRVQFARASSRSESGGKPPHSKVGDLQPRGQTDNGPPSIPQFTLDWRPMIREMIADFSRGVEAGRIAAAFHESLAAACAHLARELRIGTAFLTGGCFQNKLLAESVARRLRESGIAAVTHSIFTPNDGGLAAGQALLGWRHRLM